MSLLTMLRQSLLQHGHCCKNAAVAAVTMMNNRPQQQRQPCHEFSTSPALQKIGAGKYYNRPCRYMRSRKQIITYEMHRRPHHIGASKAWQTWHTQNLEGFRQQQGVTIAQDEVIRRFVRSILFDHIPHTLGGSEFVIKRRGNIVFVSGFLTPGVTSTVENIYWLWGFTEEILSNLLKQPVKLEMQFVRRESDLAHSYWTPKNAS